MRNEIAVLLLTVLSLVLLDPGLSDCDPDGPADCTFDHGLLCGWSESTGMSLYAGWGNDYLQFNAGSTARIESRTACQTHGDTHCLTFRYWFQESNVLDLNVILKGSQTGETAVWTMFSSEASALFEWDHASVPVTRDEDFTVIIEAKKRDGQNANKWVRVDTVIYKYVPSCPLPPASAKPLPTATKTWTQATTAALRLVLSTTAITSENKVTTTTNLRRTSISDHGKDNARSSSTGEVSTEPASHTMTPVTVDSTTSGQSSDDVTAIVGAVVGGVHVVVVVVVLLTVLQRTQLSPCFNKNRGGRCDVAVPHNVTHNLDLENQSVTDFPELTAGRGPLESGTSPQPPEDHYSVIHTAGNHPTQQPSNQIHVTANRPSPIPLSVVDATDDNPYEMIDEMEASTSI